MRTPGLARPLAALLVSTALCGWAVDWTALAADHLDPPARTDPAVDSRPDIAADIADLYLWHTADSVVIAYTFAGPQSVTLPAVYDRDVLYTVNISNANAPTDAEIQIRFRFGQDGSNTGVEITGLPDGGGVLVGPVEQTLSRNGILVRAGLFDDPFFFDSQGLRESRATGVLSFDKNRNFFGGKNITGFVIQIPRRLIETGQILNVWGFSARMGGQL